MVSNKQKYEKWIVSKDRRVKQEVLKAYFEESLKSLNLLRLFLRVFEDSKQANILSIHIKACQRAIFILKQDTVDYLHYEEINKILKQLINIDNEIK